MALPVPQLQQVGRDRAKIVAGLRTLRYTGVLGETQFDEAGTKDRKTRSSVVALKAGLHKLSMRYNNHGGDPFFRVRWAIKGQNWRNIGGGELVH